MNLNMYALVRYLALSTLFDSDDFVVEILKTTKMVIFQNEKWFLYCVNFDTLQVLLN